jgi:hypothetical protein
MMPVSERSTCAQPANGERLTPARTFSRLPFPLRWDRTMALHNPKSRP